MNIEEFLINILLDYYEEYYMVEYGDDYLSQEESYLKFDSLFFDENGNRISDKEFIMKTKDILTPQVLDAVYDFLINFKVKDEDTDDIKFDLSCIINHLVGNFFVFNYSDANSKSVIKYLEETDKEEVAQLFVENEHFGLALLSSYFGNFGKDNVYNDNLNSIYSDGHQEDLKKYTQFYDVASFTTLNDLLRNVVINLYNNYISTGCDDITALNYVWAYFTSNFDPLEELEEYGVNPQTKSIYKLLLLKIIYADVYEDVCNTSIIQSDNENDRIADVVSILLMQFGFNSIPSSEEIRNRILKHFILLQEEKEKKVQNRKKTHEDGRTLILKYNFPTYMLDEIN